MKYLLLILLFYNCGSISNETVEEESEELTATLSSIQENIFTPPCALSGCHSSTSAQADLSLADGESFENLVGVGWRQTIPTTAI